MLKPHLAANVSSNEFGGFLGRGAFCKFFNKISKGFYLQSSVCFLAPKNIFVLRLVFKMNKIQVEAKIRPQKRFFKQFCVSIKMNARVDLQLRSGVSSFVLRVSSSKFHHKCLNFVLFKSLTLRSGVTSLVLAVSSIKACHGAIQSNFIALWS